LLDLIQTIKKAALQAVQASKPMGIYYGMVTATSPLTVEIERGLAVSGVALIVPSAFLNPLNPLKINDKLIMLRQQGGQAYLVHSRV
jgi:lipoate-protein ligase B